MIRPASKTRTCVWKRIYKRIVRQTFSYYVGKMRRNGGEKEAVVRCLYYVVLCSKYIKMSLLSKSSCLHTKSCTVTEQQQYLRIRKIYAMLLHQLKNGIQCKRTSRHVQSNNILCLTVIQSNNILCLTYTSNLTISYV